MLKAMYLDLIRHGWTLPEIDEMDIHWFLELLAYDPGKRQEPMTYIDQIAWL